MFFNLTKTFTRVDMESAQNIFGIQLTSETKSTGRKHHTSIQWLTSRWFENKMKQKYDEGKNS